MGDDITIGVTEIVNNIEVTAQPNDQIVDISVVDNADDVILNITPTVIEININKGSSYAKWGDILGTLSDQTDLQSALNLKANLVGGKVPASELPSYVDDVVEVANYAALPATGETGKIYVTLDNNKIYRWSGSLYIEIAANNAVWGSITGTLSSQTDLQNALNAKFDNPTGNTTQYIAGDGSLITFPVAGQSGTLVREVRNTTGSTLTKGTIVYINGATGNKPTVAKAIATGDSTSAQTFGMLQADLANNANGYVVCIGDIVGLDTSAITEGTQLYLSSTTAGAYTTTKQVAPAHLVYIGVVTRSHPTLGQIEVKIQNGYELDEIHDVLITSKTNNDFLVYESASSLWKNKSLGTVLAGTSSQFLKGDGSLDSNTYALTSQLHNAVTIGTANGLSLSTQVLSLGLASASANGALSSTDWTTFNNKVESVAASLPLGSTGGTSPVISIFQSNASTDGYLSSTDWNTFNGKQAALSGTGFVKISGTTISYDNSTYVPTSRTLTINGTAYDLSADRSWTITAGISGSGTTNYLPKFTGSTALGNSLIYDNGTNVGIGTTSPSAKLYIRANDSDTISSIFTLAQANAAGNDDGRFEISVDAVNNLTNFISTGSNIGGFTFNSAGSERMRITSAGNVGIGTSSPYSGSTLTLQESSSLSAALSMKNRNSTQQWDLAVDAAAVDDKYLAIIDRTNGQVRMAIGSNGNVGIGTTSPSSKLTLTNGSNFAHINGGNSNTIPFLGILNAANYASATYGWGVFDNSTNGNLDIKRYDGSTTAIDVMTFQRSSGNVGIGTTSPDNGKLTILKNTSNATESSYGIAIQSNASNAYTELLLGADDTVDCGVIQTAGKNTSFTTKKLALQPQGGNVGIGTTSPSAKLDVNGIFRSIVTSISSTGEISAKILGYPTSPFGLIFRSYSSGATSIQSQREANDSEFFSLLLQPNGGNVGIGTTSPAYKLDVNGTGGFVTSVSIYSSGTPFLYFRSTRASGQSGYIKDDGNMVFQKTESGGGFRFLNSSSTILMSIDSGGNVDIDTLGTGLVYSNSGVLTSTNPSDSRLKDNIVSLNYGLNEILQLRPVSYNWKDDKINQGKQFGFIAQEVQEVMPELVKEFETEEGNRLGLDKEGIYAALVNAIKEQNEVLAQLKAEIEILKTK